MHKSCTEARLLIINADTADTSLETVLRRKSFCNVCSTNDPMGALEQVEKAPPDVIVIVMESAHDVAADVLRHLRQTEDAVSRVPVFIITGRSNAAVAAEFLESGADDVVSTPISRSELVARIEHLLNSRFELLTLHDRAAELETKMQQTARELQSSRLEALHRLSLAAELRDDDTGEHIHRVGRMSAALSDLYGCPQSLTNAIGPAAGLHDIGKIGIPDAILLKPGPLSSEEFAVMTTHTTIGAKLLSGSSSPVIRLAEQIALCHHERWNGSGYPRKLSGNRIPLAARIVAVADVFDALTHSRCYKRAWSVNAAVKEIVRLSGTAFDPDVVDAFEEMVARQFRGPQSDHADDFTPVVRYIPFPAS